MNRQEGLGMARAVVLVAMLIPLGGVIAAEQPTAMTFTAKDPGRFRLELGGQDVTTYYTSKDLSKPFFFPLLAPNGVAVTRAWPIENAGAVSHDHIHQKSAWFAHGEVSLDSGGNETARPIDFWAEAPGHGSIVLTEPVPAVSAGPLKFRYEWRGADGTPVLAERRTISAYSVAEGRLIVVDIDLKADFGPVTFGDTKEGAFAVRVHDQLRVGEKGKSNSKSRITNAEGVTGEKACWGRPSNWCDYSGEVDGKPAGIAIFDDPANRPRASWHVRDYGLMAANPFGRAKSGFPAMHGRTDLVRLKKDEHLRLRYAIFLHAGDAADGHVADGFSRFLSLRD
jgi:hypothetical protein